MALRILILDRQTEVRELFTRILEEDGSISCYSTGNKDDLLCPIDDSSFSMVLVEIEMVFGKDFLLLKLVKKFHPDAAILVTGYLNELDIIKKALRAGASGYILKPVTAKGLREEIGKYLSKKGTGAQARTG